MKLRSIVVVACVACGALGSVAIVGSGCGSSSSSDGGGSDSGTDSASANACATQRTAIFQSYCPGHESLAEVTGDCAKDCLLTPDASPSCVEDCLRSRTGGQLDDPCLACHQALADCAKKYCIGPCAPDPTGLKCLNCMCGNNFVSTDGAPPTPVNCYVPFNQCTGLGLTYCEQYEAGTFDAFPPPQDAGACDVEPDASPDAGADAPKG